MSRLTQRPISDDLWTPRDGLPARQVLLALTERIARCWGEGGLSRRVKIEYNTRLRTTLGRAQLRRKTVELNPRLLAEHPRELVPTLAHELAHLVVFFRHGRVCPHGSHFQSLMAAVNLSAAATHSLPVEHLRRRRRRYLYLHRCSDCGGMFMAHSSRRNTYCSACGPASTWDIWRAPNTSQGRQALLALGPRRRR